MYSVLQRIAARAASQMRLRQGEIEQLCRAVGLGAEDARIMAAVAVAESGGNPVIGGPSDPKRRLDTNGRMSVGIFQINLTDGPPPGTGRNGFTAQQLEDPMTNAKVMAQIFAARRFKPWGAHSSGRFKRFLFPGQLQEGMEGEAVRTYQERLNARKETTLVLVTGRFDAKTKAATSAFQKRHGLPGGGAVGPKTWNLL